MTDNEECKEWYETSYSSEQFSAQRLYPNEELCRFMGRTWFHLPYKARKNVKILELGCGSGSNLWMLKREGFDVFGVDISTEAIKLANRMLKFWNVSFSEREAVEHLSVQDMADLSFPDSTFDAVLDVFSCFCLTEPGWECCLSEVARALKKGGKFFAYTPSKRSDAFINHVPANMLDSSTLEGIMRITSPYYGNFYPFRFISEEDLRKSIGSKFDITYLERVGRTYQGGKEYFEFLVFELTKQ